MDFYAYLQGLLYGFVLALMLGPVFFALLQASILHGFRAGARMAFGVLGSDALFIGIAIAGTHSFLHSTGFQYWLGVGGGILLIFLGLQSLLKRTVKVATPTTAVALSAAGHARRKAGEILRGFYLNSLNPFAFLFWSGQVLIVSGLPGFGRGQVISYFLGTLTTILGTDLGKAAAAQRLKRLVTPARILIMNRITGAALVMFGLWLLYKVLIAHSL